MSTISASTTTTTAYKVTADTTGTLVLQTGSTPTTAVTVGSDQSVTLAGTLAVQGQTVSPYTGFKNRIINGAMVIDQRNAGASVTPTGSATYTVDRWVYKSGGVSSKASIQQNAGSVTPPAGYINYVGATSLSAYTLLTGDHFSIGQYIEGLNVADLAWGTANAATVTLFFWVRSSLTGLNGGAVKNSAGDRAYPFSFTVNSANTWEQKSINIAGDTTGTWLTTNGIGVEVSFNLGAYSNKLTTANAWAAGDYYGPTGANSIVSTNGATFYITGVQLEKGSTATSFDYRPYGTELALCQRYLPSFIFDSTNNFAFGTNSSTSSGAFLIPFQVYARTAPTGIGVSSAADFQVNPYVGGSGAATSITFNDGTIISARISANVSGTPLTANAASLLKVVNSGARMYFTGCEL